MQIQDVRGKIFDAATIPQRIVSLVPSVTEALFAFGAGARVVGVTDYCIAPREGVATKTKIGGTKNPRVEQILSLAPDLVIANVEENIKRDVDALEAHGVPAFVMFPRTVRAAIDELRVLAQLVHAQDAEAIVQPIEKTISNLQSPILKPRVFVAIWRDPWMTANGETFIGDLIETCGGENVFRESHARYPRVTVEEIARNKPEMILLPDEPYPFAACDADELGAAIPIARVHCVDGALLTWHGVRLAQAVRYFSELFHEKITQNQSAFTH